MADSTCDAWLSFVLLGFVVELLSGVVGEAWRAVERGSEDGAHLRVVASVRARWFFWVFADSTYSDFMFYVASPTRPPAATPTRTLPTSTTACLCRRPPAPPPTPHTRPPPPPAYDRTFYCILLHHPPARPLHLPLARMQPLPLQHIGFQVCRFRVWVLSARRVLLLRFHLLPRAT